MADFPFPVHAPRHSRDMARMSRETAFAADSMLTKLKSRREILLGRIDSLVNEHGFYQTDWPGWTPEIVAEGGTPTIANSTWTTGFQPDPDFPDDRVGQIAVGWLEIFFNSGDSIGTGTFGFVLPRKPRISGSVVGYFSGEADTSPGVPLRGACVHSTLGVDDVFIMYQNWVGALAHDSVAWDIANAYLLVNLMYEIAPEESS